MSEPERRHQPIRREINEMIRDPHGRLAEAKVFAVLGKAALLYILLTFTGAIIERWDVLAVIVAALVVPDVLKKMLAMKFGASVPEKKDATS